MNTYNTIIEFLKANREQVINAYESTRKEISLKDYMNEVVGFFNEHPGKARKVLKGSLDAFAYLGEAIDAATSKANAKARRAMQREVLNYRLEELNAKGWYNKNYK